MPITSNIKTNLSGTLEFAFDDTDSLRRFLTVLDNGLEQDSLFNEDIQELADNIRRVLDSVE